jgi:uracil-DNA glycosylase
VSPTVDVDAARELAELTRAIEAHVEWLVASGATGVPRAERPSAPVVAAQNPPEMPTNERPAPPAVAGPVVVSSVLPLSTVPPASSAALTVEPAAPAIAKPPALEPAERIRRLELLAESVRSCTRCALHAGRTRTVFARGTGASGLCFVGEGPGADEDAQGFPFVGKAGQLLDRMIEAMGFSRDDVYVCNIVKCRPPDNRKPEPEEMAACMPYLKEQLELIAPEVMVALGATAVQGLFGTSEGITRLRGRWKLYGGRTPVMPTFHPAFLLRNPAAKREVWDDLQAVLRHMGRQAPKR